MPDLTYLGISPAQKIHYQLSPSGLISHSLARGEGVLSGNQVLVVDTGEFRGRSPKDRYIVADLITEKNVWWGDINIPFSPENFYGLYNKMIDYLSEKDIYLRDVSACADPRHRLSLRVITEHAFQNLFVYNMFIAPEDEPRWQPEWTIISAPGFRATAETDGTRQHNFTVINFTRRVVLIGGSAYTGEIKKAVFSVLNFILPKYKQVLPMHCAANRGRDGDTAIFFGLSGTGKTTLSADPYRDLIGDDEHGWTDDSIFNFEGGCYAKTVGLTEEREPLIFQAIYGSALLENTVFKQGTLKVDFHDISKTENTRVSYPLDHVTHAVIPSVGNAPANIFFLTADAFGVLPPVSKLDHAQAMFYFLSGYTAKVAGTEHGIQEPQATFSACFGKAFLPLHPVLYANLLGKKLRMADVNIWLINTGWIGGAYGTGKRIPLTYTRTIIRSILSGQLNNAGYTRHAGFGLMMPDHCPGVPGDILHPAATWHSIDDYTQAANRLAAMFNENFKMFANLVDESTLAAAPKTAKYNRELLRT
ncbi:phosphoenolpyruvate carboxykinase (ATP) [Pedobacter sp. HMF7056]|uniref:Phosphoenolpyruvate carboxykinase (ATP) n=2 Tax=Hufsiella ginkgonis TaxID=2695274 RepID=A0A7K1XX44_9SPHI|nr:phosphoenolpyruvate carboxykinase (ATP) [Hufsiella ginkgonis]